MNITVLGIGYVGLITACCFAERGHHVMCFDIDALKIHQLSEGICPIYEEGLEEMILRNKQEGRLSFTSHLSLAASFAQVYIIAVPTPSLSDGQCDLSYIFSAITMLSSEIHHDSIMIIKSTVPPGTAATVKKMLQTLLPSHLACDVVSNPEFLKEGSAIYDCMHPDRIILGLDHERTLQTLLDLYSPYSLPQEQIVVMDNCSAEMTKYAANAMLATRISFMNELSHLCEHAGANIHFVKQGMSLDSRIGHQFLNAGAGYGGSCFPKDIKALIAVGKAFGDPTPLLEAVDEVNQRQKKTAFKKIEHYFSFFQGVAHKTVAIWGLSFKPHTDDLRESPSLTLIQQLLDHGAIVKLYDPVAIPKAKKILDHPNIIWCEDEYACALNAHGIVLMTQWPQFHTVNFSTLLSQMEGRLFLDGRNFYDPATMLSQGFHYLGIGIPSSPLPEQILSL
ncbi:MAG: UDP-glucose/GDP-mannose dehydrogenase family protein [Candidatus Rhabdochlamydia sp.]